MTVLQIIAWIIVFYGLARFVNWAQSLVPEDCDVFGAIQEECRLIAWEAEGPIDVEWLAEQGLDET